MRIFNTVVESFSDNLQKHFIDMPSRARLRSLLPQQFRIPASKFLNPAADRFIGHINASLRQQVFDISAAQCEAARGERSAEMNRQDEKMEVLQSSGCLSSEDRVLYGKLFLELTRGTTS
jgi:hypothetical protein